MTKTMEEMEREINRLKALETPYYSGLLTWTPAFVSTGASFAYSVQFGRYLVIGKLCNFTLILKLSGAPGGTTTNRLYSAVPLAPSSVANFQQVFIPFVDNIALWSGFSGIECYLDPGNSTLQFIQHRWGSFADQVTASQLLSGATILITGAYIID